MIKELMKYGGMFVLMVLIQVLILNNIQLSGYINPYLYVLFILLLPFQTPGYMLLGLAFLLGFTVDIFSNTLGMHTSATVFMAFLRPYVIDLISPRDSADRGISPRIRQLGVAWFIRYAIIMVLLHHLFLFYIEVFTVTGFFQTLIRSLLSSVFTIILVVISQFILYKD